MGVRQREPAPLLRRGLEDARVRDDRAARVGAAGQDRRPDRVGFDVHPSVGRGISGLARAGPGRGRAAHLQRRPGARLLPVAKAFEDGTDVCKPQKPDTIAKSLAIGDPADGPYALDLARTTGGSIDSVTDEEIRAGVGLLAETTGIFTETAGGVTVGVLAKLAERGDIDAGERVVVYITGGGAEDSRRQPRVVPHARDRAHGRRLRTRVRGRGASSKDPVGMSSVTVKIPAQLRAATGGEGELEVEGGASGRRSTPSSTSTTACASASPRTGT